MSAAPTWRPAPPDGNPVSTRMLHELVTSTLDPGYAAAAARSGRRRRWYDTPAVAAGCLLIGFLLVVAYIHTNRGAPAAQRVHDDLVRRVRSAQQGANDLAARESRAETDLASAQARALPAAGALAQQLARTRLAAGEVPVQGPGLSVVLRERTVPTVSPSPGRAGTQPIAQSNILSDRDVRSVVNELWSDGAEAIAVNGIRLSPTSAIRFAGQAVLVNFQPITSPYRIEAVGDSGLLSTRFAVSDVASRYQTLVSADHIGFSFRNETRLRLPADASATLRYATPEPTRTRGR